MVDEFTARKIIGDVLQCERCLKRERINEIVLPTVSISTTTGEIVRIKRIAYYYCDSCVEDLVKAINERKEGRFDDWD